MGTSKNPTRHAELVSASPLYQGIADHVRNDDCAKSVVFRSPLMKRSRIFDKSPKSMIIKIMRVPYDISVKKLNINV